MKNNRGYDTSQVVTNWKEKVFNIFSRRAIIWPQSSQKKKLILIYLLLIQFNRPLVNWKSNVCFARNILTQYLIKISFITFQAVLISTRTVKSAWLRISWRTSSPIMEYYNVKFAKINFRKEIFWWELIY